jgi:peptide-methionine (S)-S-oxide reductase
MKLGLLLPVVLGLLGPVGLVACKSVSAGSDAKPDRTAAASSAAATRRTVGTDPGHVGAGTPLEARPGDELAVFAAGCFWGVEDNFRQVPGVVATAVGYTGGTTKNPTYEQVCSHTTGHAEAVLVEYDPAKISYEQLVVVFFKNHDPTTMNRQGPDVGSQYRSAVFTFDDKQAETVKKVLGAEEKERGKKVVTIVSPAAPFWKAEEYHQQYDEKTGTHSCPLPKGLPKST